MIDSLFGATPVDISKNTSYKNKKYVTLNSTDIFIPSCLPHLFANEFFIAKINNSNLHGKMTIIIFNDETPDDGTYSVDESKLFANRFKENEYIGYDRLSDKKISQPHNFLNIFAKQMVCVINGLIPIKLLSGKVQILYFQDVLSGELERAVSENKETDSVRALKVCNFHLDYAYDRERKLKYYFHLCVTNKDNVMYRLVGICSWFRFDWKIEEINLFGKVTKPGAPAVVYIDDFPE